MTNHELSFKYSLYGAMFLGYLLAKKFNFQMSINDSKIQKYF